MTVDMCSASTVDGGRFHPRYAAALERIASATCVEGHRILFDWLQRHPHARQATIVDELTAHRIGRGWPAQARHARSVSWFTDFFDSFEHLAHQLADNDDLTPCCTGDKIALVICFQQATDSGNPASVAHPSLSTGADTFAAATDTLCALLGDLDPTPLLRAGGFMNGDDPLHPDNWFIDLDEPASATPPTTAERQQD